MGGHSCATKRGHQNQRPPESEATRGRLQVGVAQAGKTSSKDGLNEKQNLLELGLGVHTATYVCILTHCHLPRLDSPRVD